MLHKSSVEVENYQGKTLTLPSLISAPFLNFFFMLHKSSVVGALHILSLYLVDLSASLLLYDHSTLSKAIYSTMRVLSSLPTTSMDIFNRENCHLPLHIILIELALGCYLKPSSLFQREEGYFRLSQACHRMTNTVKSPYMLSESCASCDVAKLANSRSH